MARITPSPFEGDVIARLLVHNQLEREVLVGVYEEVDAHIRFEIDVILSLFRGWSPVQALHDIRHNLVPVDKALVADGVRTCHIIYKDAARFGLGVDIDDGFAALAVDAYLARGIDGAIEGVVAKLAGIEAQEVVRLDIEVVAQPCEVLVVDASAFGMAMLRLRSKMVSFSMRISSGIAWARSASKV